MTLDNIVLQRAGRILISGGILPLAPGKVTVLFGPSGGGKSTLIYALADLDPSVQLESSLGASPFGTEQVGLVPQQAAVFEDLRNAGNNILFAYDHAMVHKNEERDKALAEAEANLGVKREWRFPLSGGQKQRIAIARALAGKAQILLCDEPTSGLDPASRKEAISAIREAAREGVAVLVVTHDVEWNRPEAADRVVILNDRRLIEKQVGDLLDSSLFLSSSMSGDNTSSEPAASRAVRLCEGIGRLAWWSSLFPFQIGRGLFGGQSVSRRWLVVHLKHYGKLVMGLSSLIYLLAGGALVGFASLFFSVGALSVQPHLQGILAPELMSGSGFGLYRVIIPLITALLVSAKCGSAVAADIGNRQYGGQIAVMRTLRANPETHLLFSILIVMAVGMPILNALAFVAASGGSLFGYLLSYPGETAYSWSVYFFRLIQNDGSGWWLEGTLWNTSKLALSGAGVGVITYRCGIEPKSSHTDVGRDISRATLWASLWCLVVFTFFAFFEF